MIKQQQQQQQRWMCKSASQVVLSWMQLTLHATRRTPHVRSAMFGESVKTQPDVLRSGFVGMRESMVMRLYTIMQGIEYTPPPHTMVVYTTTSMHDMGTHPSRLAPF